jgi:hypothetical protein
MTNAQKEKIALMRSKGETYANIADSLGLSLNTVKSYCSRNDVGSESKKGRKKLSCEFCKKPMAQSSQPSRRFCCDTCRMAWWKAHPKQVNRKAVYEYICPVCHKAFTAYGNNHRIYCSRKCYGKSKAKATRARQAVAK